MNGRGAERQDQVLCRSDCNNFSCATGRHVIRSFALLPALLAAASFAQTPRKPLAEACPNLTAAERTAIERTEKDGSVLPELLWYSRDQCVSLAESNRRMQIQQRGYDRPETEPGGPPPPPLNSIPGLTQALERQEAATFSGIWIEHQPTYRVVVAFTRDAAATLRKYTSDPVFVPLERPGPSQVDLTAARDRVSRDLARFGARPSMSSSNVTRGRVEIAVVGELAPFRAAVARGEVDLPPYVDIRGPAPLRFAAPPLPGEWRAVVKAFPRQKFRSDGPEPELVRSGTVVLEDGCLRVKGERRNRVIVWPNEGALDLVSQPGKVRIVDRRSGKSIEVGRRVDFGGNSGELPPNLEIIDIDPACPGPYFMMGKFEPLEPIEQAEIEARARGIQYERKVSQAQALQLARDERAREDRFVELGQRLLREAPASYAGISPYQGRATIKFSRDPQGEIRRLVPADLRPFARAERAPRPLAALRAERKAVLDRAERLGISATANEDIEQGRIVIGVEELRPLARAAAAGKIKFPEGAVVLGQGWMPEGQYSQDGFELLNRRLEAVPDWAEMRALAETTKVPGYLVTYRKGEPDRPPSRRQSLEITRSLVSAGYTAEDLKALHTEGLFPAKAQVEQNGRGTLANGALLVQEVVVAEVLEVKPELLGDGYRTTVRLRVTEGLKGDLQRADEALVRFISGVGSDGKFYHSSQEPPPLAGLPNAMQPGSRWLMFLSEGARAREATLLGKAAARPAEGPRIFASRLWPIKGNQVGATYSEASPGSLAEVRAQLEPVGAAFDRAAGRRGAPLQRRIVP
jgi:hypothetical protein